MKVEYISHMGSELTVANSARVSFDKQSTWDEDGSLRPKDAQLIHYLAKHNHFTPFTHCQITLRETVPIFVARQRFKHQVGFTYNEISRRYVDDSPKFFYPDEWRERPGGSVKQGSGGRHGHTHYFRGKVWQYTESMKNLYEEMIDAGVAPEQARMVLPQSMYTSYYVTGSLAAFARLYKLRSDPHAQAEIQDLAEMIAEVIRPLYPVSWPALTEN